MSRLTLFWASSDSASKYKKFRFIALYILCFGVIIALICSLYSLILRALYPTDYSEYVKRYSEEYGLSEALVYSVILCESDFDPTAVSGAGAGGLMQLQRSTFDWMLERYGLPEGDIFGPEDNIRAGCAYLHYLTNRFIDTETVLAAYNGGEGNVTKWLADERYSEDGRTLKVIPFHETELYVRRVTAAIVKYEKIYNIK